MNKAERQEINKRKGIERFKKYHGYHPDNIPPEEQKCFKGGVEGHIGILGRTGKPCSCHMCRNERRSGFYNEEEKLTLQERKAKEDAELQIEEFENERC